MSRRRPSHSRPLVLLAGAPALVAVTIAVSLALDQRLGSLEALLCLSLVYWIGCWTLALAGAPRQRLAAMYRTPWSRRPLELVLTWGAVAGTFAWVFLPHLRDLSPVIFAGIILLALVNGVTEELLWRGAFVATFPGSAGLGYLLPTALFTAWHIALYLLPGIDWIHRGPIGLISGAALAGLAWGLVVWRRQDLASVTLAHVLTNVFTFTGLAQTNWFGAP